MCNPKAKSSESEEAIARPSSRFSVTSSEPKVLIVGAGAAGISCATKLLSAGIKEVTIFEAEDRIGGRIHTIPFGDNNIDLGAQWCHGEEGNIVHEIVQDLNMLETSGNLYVTAQCIRSNGEVLSETLVARLKFILGEIFETRHKDLRTYSGSFGEYLTERFNALLAEEENSDIDLTLAIEFFNNFKKVESAETASEVEEVSARGFQHYKECKGDYMLHWKDKGYIEFLRLLMKTNQTGKEFGILHNKIKFNKRVKWVQWKRNDGRVKIKCQNDENTYDADHVVLTVSLGVLKVEREAMFEPMLPPVKKKAIDGLSFGTVSKIFLEFEEPFWPEDWTGFCTLWREEDAEKIRNTNWEWIENVYAFYGVTSQPRLLLAWSVGKYSSILETYSDDEIKAGCMYIFDIFLPTWNVPEPINIVVTRWNTNSNFRGTYSYRSMITETFRTSAYDLAQPLSIMVFTSENEDGTKTTDSAVEWKKTIKPVLLFAGEATHSQYFSTVHGAVESGFREANRLIGYYQIEF